MEKQESSTLNSVTQFSKIAYFDFDGTLIPWDSQLLFSNYIIRLHPWRRLLLIPFVLFLPFYFLHLVSQNWMKRLFLSYLMFMSSARAEQLAESFAHLIVDKYLYSDVLALLKEYQQKDYKCLLISASPTLYMKYIGQILLMDETLGTDIAYKDPYPLAPKLPFGANKGSVKVLRLNAMGYINTDDINPDSVAVSDSKADLPLLKACAHTVLINPSSKLTSWGKINHSRIMTPVRPWSSIFNRYRDLVYQFLGLYPL